MNDERKTKKQLISELRELRKKTGRSVSSEAQGTDQEKKTDLSLILSQSPDVLAVYDSKLRYTYINETGASFLGTVPSEVIGKTNREIIGQGADALESYIRQAIVSKGKIFVLHEIPLPDEVRLFDTIYTPVLDKSGKVKRVIGICRDVTEDRLRIKQLADIAEKKNDELIKTKKGLREGEERFRALFDNAPLAYQSLDSEGNLIEVNETWCKTLGYRKEEVVGRNFSEFIHHDFQEVFRENFPKFKKLGSVLGVEFEMIRKNGSTIIVSFDGKIGLDQHGSFRQTHCVFKDISKRKRAEDALRKNEAMLRALLNAVNESVFLMKTDGTVVAMNETAAKRLGVRATEIAGCNIDTFLFPNVAEKCRNYAEQVISSGRPLQCEDEQNGRWIEYSICPVMNENGLVTYLAIYGHDITDRKLAGMALQQSEEKFRAIANYTVHWESWFGTDGKYLWVNPAVERMTGYSVDEILAMPDFISTLIAGEDRDQIAIRFHEALRGGSEENFEFRVLRKDGTQFWAGASWQPIFDPQGNPLGIRASGQDITERKNAENTLRESEEKYRLLFEGMSDAIYVHEVTPEKPGKFLAVNNAACKMLGYTKEEFMKLEIKDIDVPEQKEKLPFILENLFRDRYVLFETEHIAKDGTRVPVEVNVRLFDLMGKPAVLSVARDITDRRKADEEMRSLSLRQKAILASVPDIIMEVDHNKIYTWANHAGYEFFGDDVLGREASYYFEGEQNVYAVVQQLFDGTEDIIYVESWQRRRDGEKRLLAWWCKVLKNENGNVRGGISTARDITEQKLAEEALRRSEADLHDSYFEQATINLILSESLEDISLEMILQKALNMILSVPWLSFEPIGSIHLVEDNSELLVMKAQCNLSDMIRDVCSRIPFGKCHCGKAAQSRALQFVSHVDEEHEICSMGKVAHGHYIVPILFGKKVLGTINIYIREGHIRNQNEEEFLSAVAATLASVIVRKQTEAEHEKLHAQLIQSQKMEAVGLLAGGIAHDFNNILTAIMGFGYILRMKLNEGDPLRLYPERILVASEKAIHLTRSLLAFSRKQITDPRPVNINQIIAEVHKMFLRIIGEDIEVHVLPSDEAIMVMVDPNQMEQVLMNLTTNARDAMPEGGLLTIKTETLEIDEAFVKEHGFGTGGKYAVISITDTGTGMDKETMEKIFEPFFTTKDVGKGTGLGLAMVYGIINQNKGHINVYSEPGEGTTFKIYLPLTQRMEKPDESMDIVSPALGTETVLLAEDSDEVRLFTRELLEDYGYDVIEAIDGVDAIEKFMKNRDRIQLLLFDVIMPRKNGKEAYKKIKEIAPNIKVLFSSGYPADVVQSKGIVEKGMDLIIKPVSPSGLLRKIREILDR